MQEILHMDGLILNRQESGGDIINEQILEIHSLSFFRSNFLSGRLDF
jgi:hypothetical protein